MTINKRAKNSRFRGSKTHGYGSMKKHRGAGSRGGRGMAGTGKRADVKKSKIWKQKKYFGKHGFTSKRQQADLTVNVGFLDQHVHRYAETEGVAEQNGDYTIDLSKLGFTKLLSHGRVTRKFNITVDKATEKAVEKIKQAGGSVTLPTTSE